jgi:hypothetical protein
MTKIYLSKHNTTIIIKDIRRVRVKIGIILLALLPMLIVSGVDGIGCSISGGKGGNDYGYGNHIEAGNGIGVSGHFSIQGDNLAGNCNFKGEGRLKVSETKTDKKGDSVTLTAKGVLLSGDYYKPTWCGGNTFISGTQGLKATGNSIECTSQAVNRDGLASSVSAGVGKGSIDIKQGATASDSTADAWQGINSAMGENIKLNAETSDKLKQNMADSSVTIDCGSLVNYNSEAQASKQNGYIDLYAIHGAFNLVDKKVNPLGSISGDIISSKGSTTSETGLAASYYVTIQGRGKKPAVEGRFDWGTETTSNGWVIAVPLESPFVWGGIPGVITLSASKISSHSEATGKTPVDLKDCNVNVKNWVNGNGFAQSSEAGVNPKP